MSTDENLPDHITFNFMLVLGKWLSQKYGNSNHIINEEYVNFWNYSKFYLISKIGYFL